MTTNNPTNFTSRHPEDFKAELVANLTEADKAAIAALKPAFDALMAAASTFDAAWNALTGNQKASLSGRCGGIFGSLTDDYAGAWSGGQIGKYHPETGMPRVIGQAVNMTLPRIAKDTMDSIVWMQREEQQRVEQEQARRAHAEQHAKANEVAISMGFKNLNEMMAALKAADVVERQTFTVGV